MQICAPLQWRTELASVHGDELADQLMNPIFQIVVTCFMIFLPFDPYKGVRWDASVKVECDS